MFYLKGHKTETQIRWRGIWKMFSRFKNKKNIFGERKSCNNLLLFALPMPVSLWGSLACLTFGHQPKVMQQLSVSGKSLRLRTREPGRQNEILTTQLETPSAWPERIDNFFIAYKYFILISSFLLINLIFRTILLL